MNTGRDCANRSPLDRTLHRGPTTLKAALCVTVFQPILRTTPGSGSYPKVSRKSQDKSQGKPSRNHEGSPYMWASSMWARGATATVGHSWTRWTSEDTRLFAEGRMWWGPSRYSSPRYMPLQRRHVWLMPPFWRLKWNYTVLRYVSICT